MEEKIIIRKAKIEDFQRVHELAMQVHKLHVKERGDIYKDADPLKFEEFIEDLSNESNIYLVAELENKIIGICFSHIKEMTEKSIMKARRILYIDDLCIDETMQRKGIGRKMYNQIVQVAKKRNVDSVELLVWGFNKKAINFYKNMGMNVKNIRFEQRIERT